MAEDDGSPDRVGLVLSGGGARGFAHIGVLRALEEGGIPIDCIGGTSMGAVIGGLYACGIGVDSLTTLAHRKETFLPPNSFEELSVFQKHRVQASAIRLYFSGLEYRLPRSLISDFNINWMLVSHTAEASLASAGDFDALPIPFRSVGLDLISGERVVFRSGDLARSIRTSMSLPVTFPPMKEPGRLLIDGGPIDNLPIGLVRDELGAEKIIAVNVSNPWEANRGEDVRMVALRLVDVLSQRVDSTRLEGWDVWIEPELADARIFDFSNPEPIIAAGYEAGMKAIPRIRAMLEEVAGGPQSPPPLDLPDAVFDPHRDKGYETPAEGDGLDSKNSARVELEDLTVGEIRLTGRRMSFSWVPRTELGIEPGDRFSLDRLERGLRRLHSTQIYDAVWPSLHLGDSTEVDIELYLEERAPSYVGIHFLYDNGRNLNVSLEVSHRNFFRLGETLFATAHLGNFVDGVEFGVRSSHVRGLPLALDIQAESLRSTYRRDEFGQMVRRIRGVEMSTGLLAGRWAVLLGGLRFWEDRGQGSDQVDDWDATNRTLFAILLADGTDERYLPRSGTRLRAEYQFFVEDDLNASHHSMKGELAVSLPFGNLAMTPKAAFAGVSEPGLPFRNWHRLDLSRATWGRFESDLYSPYTAKAGVSLSYNFPLQSVVWCEATSGLRSETFEGLGDSPELRSVEGGFLQRTPVGPIFLGISAEEHRSPYYFIQVGHEFVD